MQAANPAEITVSAPPPDAVYEPPMAAAQAVESTTLRRVAATRFAQAQAQVEIQVSAAPPDLLYEPPTADAAPQTQSLAEVTVPAPSPLSGLKALEYDDMLNAAPDPERLLEDLSPVARLDMQTMFQIIQRVTESDTGDTPYSFTAADLEYTTPNQPAYQMRHFGLVFGIVRASQATGQLGALLTIMHRRSPEAFTRVFGAQWQTLLTVTNAAAPEARLATIEGQTLWSSGWIERFQQAGTLREFQVSQIEHAIESLFRPMLPIALGLGFVTDRGLALVFDRVVIMGLGAGLRWVTAAASLLQTSAQRTTTLQLLGYNRLQDAQRALNLTETGVFDIPTHAALVGALRSSGSIPLPFTHELMHRLIDAADGVVHDRLIRLRDHTGFEDIVLTLG